VKTTTLLALFALAMPAGAFAAEGKSCGTIECAPVRIKLSDQASLQHGARIFVNYCLSCHSASYMRYNRMGTDLGIPEDLLKRDLMFTTEKVGDLMQAVMRSDDAKAWFGTAPPDLTLIARSRDPAWIYTYLRSFYRDDKTTSGWNNIVFPNVAMPHVLWEWQGEQRPVYQTVSEKVHVQQNGKTVERTVNTSVFDHFEVVKPGTMSSKDYDRAVADLVNFLVYLGEPAKLLRYSLGIYVLVFLAVFLVFAYLLKKEYWKDVH
jgi:ubiquinol-cytochrome c reductase cytochrome c1 subunit